MELTHYVERMIDGLGPPGLPFADEDCGPVLLSLLGRSSELSCQVSSPFRRNLDGKRY